MLQPSLQFNRNDLCMSATLFKKETLAQMFSCEFCEISKSTFSYRTPPVAASEFMILEPSDDKF